ncbi:hypothetical protein D3C71_968850 [compost metagenome]
MALRLRGIEQGAGLHIELFDLHVRGQGIARDSVGVDQTGKVVAEMTFGEGPQEARFQTIAFGLRRIQRQRGVQLQRARSIGFHPRVQRIEQPVRLAQG